MRRSDGFSGGSAARHAAGFTLIESVMVITITGVLAAIVATFIVPAINAYFSTRARAALVDSADVVVQKARTAAFFSNRAAADELNQLPDAAYAGLGSSPSTVRAPIASYVSAATGLLGSGTFSNGTAFSTRSIGNISAPTFPENNCSAKAWRPAAGAEASASALRRARWPSSTSTTEKSSDPA